MRKIIKRNEYGQATVEFLLTFTLSFIFIMFFLSLALNLTSGYMAHLATFSASRVFLVYDENTNGDYGRVDRAAANQGVLEFNKYQLNELGKIAGIKGKPSFNMPEASKYEYVGAKLSFEKEFSFIKVLVGEKKLNLLTESFLGREPTRLTCLDSVKKQVENNTKFNTLYDNGC